MLYFLHFFLASTKVMNFQTIRDDFNQQVKEQAEALEAEQMRAHLTEEMERQDRVYAKARYNNFCPGNKTMYR